MLAIPAGAIDHARARGLVAEQDGAIGRPHAWGDLLRSPPIAVFAAASAIFGFANAPLLQLVAQKLALAHPGYESGVTSAAIIVTQLGDHPDGAAGHARQSHRPQAAVDRRLRRGSAARLALRRAQRSLLAARRPALDGIGGGLYDALLPLTLADLTRGSGRYSLARGVLGAIQGIGGSTGQGAAGALVAAFGYGPAFLALAAIAFLAMALMVVAMPETRSLPDDRARPAGAGQG